MAGARKDNKGRVLLKGESYREKDKRYQFKYTDSMGRTKYIYSKDIITPVSYTHLRAHETD